MAGLRGRRPVPAAVLAALLAGALAGAGQVPLALWPAGLAGLAAVIALVAHAPGRRAGFARGWAAGAGYFAATLFWIVEPFFVDAARHGWMAPFALAGLAGGLALFWGAAGWAGHALGAGPRGRALAVAAALAAAGLARAYVLTGFPWALPAYIWTETPVIQAVAWIGPHGLNLATLAAAALPAALAGTGARGVAAALPGAAAAVALAGAGWFAGALRLDAPAPAPAPPAATAAAASATAAAPGARPLVRIVQPNAAQHLKWRRDMIPVFFERKLALTAAPAPRPPAAVIWPETAMPYLLEGAGPAIAAMRAAAGPEAALVFGIQRAEGAAFFNSLVALAPGAEPGGGAAPQVYDKHHLVPFGEYMPLAGLFERAGVFGLAARAAGGYTPGPGPRVIEVPGLGRALPLICYEAVFPQDLRAPGARPDFLLHATNDAWFGRAAGPYQHLAQARVRAIEQGLPMLRAANTGVSAVIDARGRVLASLPLGEAGRIDARLPAPLARPTPYARSGDLPAAALVAAGLLAAALRRRRRK